MNLEKIQQILFGVGLKKNSKRKHPAKKTQTLGSRILLPQSDGVSVFWNDLSLRRIDGS